MVTVSTLEELQGAINARETQIVITGEMVEVFKKHRKARKIFIIVSMTLVVLGLFLSPLTDGYSMIAGAIGILMGVGTFAFKGLPFAVPFAIRTVGVTNAMQVLKSGKAWINPDGSLSAVLKYKD
ncbi:MAG: hypothetical protein MJ002_06995 [Paludibacteraceae bacterium]|nr:hypothetical protein [Paludibacteraceae bacterium]